MFQSADRGGKLGIVGVSCVGSAGFLTLYQYEFGFGVGLGSR
jgi:hypothetical protein